ncbi:MAG TPA: head completion protein [Saccharofermentans sp.]|nr:head completion protein [Saccharofermentans sp.]
MKKGYGYKQGKFVPRNKEKYIGCLQKIYFRSAWELQCFRYMDLNPAILQWGSESTVVEYVDPSRAGTTHRYFIDLSFTVKDKTGKISKIYCEVKPHKETIMPVKGRKSDKRYYEEAMTYIRNTAKWNAASKFAEAKGAKFIILTEKEIFPAGVPKMSADK